MTQPNYVANISYLDDVIEMLEKAEVEESFKTLTRCLTGGWRGQKRLIKTKS